MNAISDHFDDTLEPLGIATGAFLVLFGLGTIVGSPWATTGAGTVVVKVLGAIATIALGAGLAYLSWTGDA